MTYQFTNNWFEDTTLPMWKELLTSLKPQRILEIGSYEGASACGAIRILSAQEKLEIHCVDTWGDGENPVNKLANMSEVEERFDRNLKLAVDETQTEIALRKWKLTSDEALIELYTSGKQEYFDFIYVDGAHQAPQVLSDAILGFKLLRTGGVIGFDDYLWAEAGAAKPNLLRGPKVSIDAFTNIYHDQTKYILGRNHQVYLQKIGR